MVANMPTWRLTKKIGMELDIVNGGQHGVRQGDQHGGRHVQNLFKTCSKLACLLSFGIFLKNTLIPLFVKEETISQE